MSYTLPMSQVEVRIDFDPEEVRARYGAELVKRAATGAPRADRKPPAVQLDAADPWTPYVERPAVSEEVEAVIIGGGFGGLLAAARLKEEGVDSLRIVEAGGDFGGTWYWNRYPGSQCDIEGYIYLPLLEETGYMPSTRYPLAQEIFEHSQRIGRHFGLYEGALFHTAATRAVWDGDSQRWLVTTDRGDELRTRFLVRSNGALGAAPTLPAVEGLETFPGRIFHSSRWDYAYTGGSPTEPMTNLHDKTVVVVGSGASAVQVVKAVADQARQVFVVQRTPGPVFGYRRDTATDPEWYSSQVAGWQQRRMRNFDLNTSFRYQDDDLVGDQFVEMFRALGTADNVVDDVSSIDPREVGQVMEIADLAFSHRFRQLVDSVVQDPETAERLKPWYGLLCKRMTYNDGFLESFNRPNVSLIDAPVVGIESVNGSTVTAAGERFDADCIVFATGFDTSTSSEARAGITVLGRDGRSLSEHNSPGLRSQHGIMTDRFPNLFTSGLNQTAVALNFTSMLDVQARHIAAIVGHARANGYAEVEPTEDAVEAWSKTVAEAGLPFRPYFERCVPGYYNGYGNLDQGVFTGQAFVPGTATYADILEEARADGRFSGLEFRLASLEAEFSAS
ncbi:monooxygenase [Sinomonas cyclohexanicum]|uniref:Monooxygenase n=1 Tax=Sinomonas cyclohexanicum TaxID=322009 RepID=A0ABN6FF78_SINCY|nr:NAD(P)/FAD-dependent oxidoreductase [Corynebacterium cyclohexanicum]BCT75234.1 monooxygenase [Corynebacterium cyclohexanicum]